MKLQDAVTRIRLLEAGLLKWNADVDSNRRALAAVLDEMDRISDGALDRAIARLERDLNQTTDPDLRSPLTAAIERAEAELFRVRNSVNCATSTMPT